MKRLTFFIAFMSVQALAYSQGNDNMYPQGSALKVPEPLLLPEFPMSGGDVVYQEVFEFEGAEPSALYGTAPIF